MIKIKEVNKETAKSRVKLSSPWVVYYRKVQAMFIEDPEVKVVFDEDDLNLRLLVESTEKAEALAQLLPDRVMFGNITLTISVIPANKPMTKADYIRNAFKGNPAVSIIETVSDPSLSNPMTFVEFEPKVVQFFTDTISDLHGLTSTLYESLAKELFKEEQGIFFTTDKVDTVPAG